MSVRAYYQRIRPVPVVEEQRPRLPVSLHLPVLVKDQLRPVIRDQALSPPLFLEHAFRSESNPLDLLIGAQVKDQAVFPLSQEEIHLLLVDEIAEDLLKRVEPIRRCRQINMNRKLFQFLKLTRRQSRISRPVPGDLQPACGTDDCVILLCDIERR